MKKLYEHKLNKEQLKPENYTPKKLNIPINKLCDMNVSIRRGNPTSEAIEYQKLCEYEKKFKSTYPEILHKYQGQWTKEEAAIKYKEFETELNNTRLNLFNQYFTVQDTGFLQVITIK